jgi:alpha-tubulin suppressor-like RCC1 family protein
MIFIKKGVIGNQNLFHLLFFLVYFFVLFSISCGQLGQSNIQDNYLPEVITNIPNIRSIFCGHDSTMFLTENEVFVMGNFFSSFYFLLFLSGKNSLGEMGLDPQTDFIKPRSVMKSNNIVSICCGGSHFFIYKCDTFIYFFYYF